MPCDQDIDLLNNNIRVDSFRGIDKNDMLFLTHAHSDHSEGLQKSSKWLNRIYCTQVTSDLILMRLTSLNKKQFIILEYDTPVLIHTNIYVTAIPSYHCDGSSMFLFQFCPNVKILYTGDFRFHPSMRCNSVLTNGIVDKMYYDDTFMDVPHIDGFPSHFTTGIQLVREIKRTWLDHGKLMPIYISSSILGVEPILRYVSKELNVKFSVSPSMVNTVRYKQLIYLMSDEILSSNEKVDDTEPNIILGHRHIDDTTKGNWIIPTSTHFLYKYAYPEKLNKNVPSNHKYVWFATHPNQYEISRLKSLIGVIYERSCGFSIVKQV